MIHAVTAPSYAGFTRAQRADREKSRRALARRHLIDFCAYVDEGAAYPNATDTFIDNYYRARHLRLIAKYIESAVDGTLWHDMDGAGKNVLLITTPPGHWKSSLISRKFPAWFVGRQLRQKLSHQVILTSYNSSLATANNAKVLELIQDNKFYKNVFPDVRLSAKSQSSEEWTIAGSAFTSCKAAGVGAGLTGYHAAVAIVDDPIKDRAEANSVARRETLWDWWKDVLRTRLVKGWHSFILGVWTRWTEDDPAGRLMEMRKNGELTDNVVMLRLPALAETQAERKSAGGMGLPVDPADPLGREPGQALWPEMEPKDELEATRKSFPITFDGLYQGRPRPAGGYVANRDQLKQLPALPRSNIKWIWATDWALTKKEVAPTKKKSPDFTVVGLIGLWTPKDVGIRLVIGFIKRGQLEAHDAINMVFGVTSTQKQAYPIRAGQANFEKIIRAIMRRDRRFLRHSIKNYTRKQIPGDKMTRAMPWLELAQAGNVYVVQGPWNVDFYNELESFPHGTNDDQIDMVSIGAHAHGLAQRDKRARSAKVKGFG